MRSGKRINCSMFLWTLRGRWYAAVVLAGLGLLGLAAMVNGTAAGSAG